jgi:hypothetical protein
MPSREVEIVEVLQLGRPNIPWLMGYITRKGLTFFSLVALRVSRIEVDTDDAATWL